MEPATTGFAQRSHSCEKSTERGSHGLLFAEREAVDTVGLDYGYRSTLALPGCSTTDIRKVNEKS